MDVAPIGKILRQARIKKGYSLEELQQITKIQQRYLESLEDDDFSALPGTFYVRSFIEQYATAVDVDPDPLLRAFNGEDIDLEKATAVKKAPATVGEVSRKDIRTTQPRPKRTGVIPAIILGLLAVAIIAAVTVITIQDRKENPIIQRPDSVILNSSTDSTTAESTAATTVSSTVESTATSTTESTQEVLQPEFVLDSEDSSRINMTLKNVTNPVTLEFTGSGTSSDQRCWVGVTSDSGASYLFQQTLNPQDTGAVTLPNDLTEVSVVLGAATYATIKVNGQDLPFNQSNLPAGKRIVHLTMQYQAAE